MKQNLKKRRASKGLVLLLLLLFCGFTAASLQAQEKITGAVFDAEGSPLPGVSILQKGTSNGVETDFDGKFSITVTGAKRTLIFSYLGFKQQAITVGNRKVINITLEEDAQSLDEIVIIGYAPVERKKVLGAVATVKAASIAAATPVSALDGVQGKLSGVQILSNNGPGQGFDIRIRGVSTFGSGTSPLFVVDGQQLEDIDNLDPADIESLEVIKDGATAAIYGSRAANGVVIITTKSGKAGKVNFSVSSITGVNMLVGDLRVANSSERLEYERIRNGNPDANPRALELDSLSLLRRSSYDLQKLVTRPALRQTISVDISGGDDKMKYRWGTGYLTESGIVINSGYKRINTALRLDITPTDKIKIGTNVRLSFEHTKGISESQVFTQLVQRIPYFPLFEPNGDFTPTLAGRQNPLAQATLRDNNNRIFRAQIFNYAQLNITPKFSLRATLGLNFRYQKISDFAPRLVAPNFNVGTASGALRNNLIYDIQQENFVNYKNKFGNHSISAVAGIQIQKYARELEDIRSINFTNDLIPTFNNAAAESVTSDRTEHRKNNLYSLFAGFDYDFNNKYFIGATIRRDGSSRFGDNNEFGYFPAVKLGWRVSGEDFLKDSDVINDLKLRATWGVVGNERIADYAFTSALLPGYNYNGQTGFAPERLGNPDLSWEETTSLNLGVDLSMFNNRLEINADVWEKRTVDLLANVPLPEESGYTSILKNVGGMTNRGIDLNISGTILKAKGFSWRSNFNIGFLENEVTKLDGGTPFQSGFYKIEEGQPIGNMFGYKNLGVYQYDESNAYTLEGVRLTPNFDANGDFVNHTLNGVEYPAGDVQRLRAANQTLEGGDIIWEDLDGNFVIDADDRQIIGNGLSTIYGGFSHDITYKNFSISTLFDFSLGHDIYARYDEERNDLNSSNETPGPDRIAGAWRRQGDVTVYPRLNRVTQQRLRANSFYVSDGSFIKWRYLRFNYKLSKKVMDKIDALSALSINLAINNVLTWTNYIGYNPELGNRGNPLQLNQDRIRYPNDREIILGLSVQF